MGIEILFTHCYDQPYKRDYEIVYINGKLYFCDRSKVGGVISGDYHISRWKLLKFAVKAFIFNRA